MGTLTTPFRNCGCLLLILLLATAHLWGDGGIEGRASAALAATSCPANLTLGVTIECSIAAAGETDAYPFPGSRNDRVRVIVLRPSDSIDPSIRIMDPAGKQVCAAFNSDIVAEIAGCILSSTGTHTLLVDDTYHVKTGSYTLYSQRLNNPENARTLTPGQPLLGSITGTAEFNSFRFEGIISSTIALQATRTSLNLRPRIRVYGTNGFAICNAFSGGGSAELTDCVLPQSGTYTVLIEDALQSAFGDYTITLDCPTTRCDPLSYYIPLIAKE